MNVNRHYKSLKHEKKYRLSVRNNSINLIKEEGLYHSNRYIERMMGKQFPELEELKYFDGWEIYLDNDIDYNRHVETLKHKINARMVDGEIIKNGYWYKCKTCETNLSQINCYSLRSIFIHWYKSIFIYGNYSSFKK